MAENDESKPKKAAVPAAPVQYITLQEVLWNGDVIQSGKIITATAKDEMPEKLYKKL